MNTAKTIIWQQEGNNPQNPENLAAIAGWWSKLNHKEITWQQRLIPPSGNPEDADWENQRFDEEFAIEQPQLRGITLYWRKPAAEERNITARKLELDLAKQRLDVYPQSQPQVVIRIASKEIIYQQVELVNPLAVATTIGENTVLLLRDKEQKLEVKVTISQQNFAKLVRDLEQK